MKISAHTFLAALTYFTRIRTPKVIDARRTEGAACLAPVIGWIVGAAAAVTFAISYLIFPIPVAVILSLAASILITGGLHEDGWMDFCDGFGGGTDREQTLRIMRDSQVGAFAVMGAIVVLSLKITILSQLVSVIAPDRWRMLGTLVARRHGSRMRRYSHCRRDAFPRMSLRDHVPLAYEIFIDYPHYCINMIHHG